MVPVFEEILEKYDTLMSVTRSAGPIFYSVPCAFRTVKNVFDVLQISSITRTSRSRLGSGTATTSHRKCREETEASTTDYATSGSAGLRKGV